MDNLIIASVILIVVGVVSLGVIGFLKLEKDKQMQMVKEWLLLAVVQAEKVLGSGTGEIKLRYVYDLFLDKFKLLSHVLSFEQFSNLVDEALILMRTMIASNENVRIYVLNKEMVSENE